MLVVAAIALYPPAVLTTPLLAVSTLATLAVWLYAIVEAWKTARHLSLYLPEPRQTGAVYTAVIVLLAFLLLPLLVSHVRSHYLQPFSIPTGSMHPTLQTGDYLFANMRYNCSFCGRYVHRGDVAIFVYPDIRNVYHVKRVIGLRGDQISMEAGVVSVNGEALSNANGQSIGENNGETTESIDDRRWQVISASTEAFEPTVVAPGHVFLLGDDRSNSRDSRHYGEVPLSDVVGSATPTVVFSRRGRDSVGSFG